MLTDPIADMLTRIRNASKAGNKEVIIPHSNIKEDIAKILKEENYVNDYKVVKHLDEKRKPTAHQDIIVTIKYDVTGKPALSGIDRISKPGLRHYCKKDELPRVLNDLGIAIVSTSQGVMTNKKARKLNLGGEILAYVY